jgi:hypothetical protein
MWNTTEEEVEHRRRLLRLAANGNVQASEELEQEYHVHVYSPAQLALYVPARVSLPGGVRRKIDSILDLEGDAVVAKRTSRLRPHPLKRTI